MEPRKLVWLPVVKRKLTQFQSERFSPEETFDFISQFVIETESLLVNPILGKVYTEETGVYVGLSRIVVKKFRVYFEEIENEIIIVAILFPGEK